MKFSVHNEFNLVPVELKNKTYIVGGFVRDLILGKKSNDIDFVVCDSSHEEMISLGFKKVGKDFPVYLDKYGNEFALARTERKSSKGYNGFEVSIDNVSLEEDLLRRDITINSMAIDCNGNLIDPYDGFLDLKYGVIRHTSLNFAEDPVRVLRVARFRARYNFIVSNETRELMYSLKEELKELEPNRVFKELEKALSLDNVHLFFEELKESKTLEFIFPDIGLMTKIEHNSKYHCEGSVYNHSILALREACKLTDLKEVRLAAFLHDIAKVDSFVKYGDFKSHYKKDLIYEAVNCFAKKIALPKLYKKMIIMGALYHHKIHDLETLKAKTILKMFNEKSFAQNIEELNGLITIAKSDDLGRVVSNYSYYRSLNQEELEGIFNSGSLPSFLFDGCSFSKIEKSTVNEKLLKSLFIEYKKPVKEEVAEFKANNHTKKSISDFVYELKLKKLKGVLNGFKNKKESK